jgi:hypothetical protein
MRRTLADRPATGCQPAGASRGSSGSTGYHEAVCRFTGAICLAVRSFHWRAAGAWASPAFSILAARQYPSPFLSAPSQVVRDLPSDRRDWTDQHVRQRTLVLCALMIGAGALVQPIHTGPSCIVLEVGPVIVVPATAGNLFRFAIALALACLPASVWCVRNYGITGRFPLLTSVEGETLYGANNDVVAGELSVWGHWVMPDEIPGETPKRELAKLLGSDIALNDYYNRKAVSWLSMSAGDPRSFWGNSSAASSPCHGSAAASFIAFSCFALQVLSSSISHSVGEGEPRVLVHSAAPCLRAIGTMVCTRRVQFTTSSLRSS